MRRFKLVTVLFLLSLLSCVSQPSDIQFTVMTWNIWHGGIHGPKEQNFKEDTANTVNILKVINLENPDIICMQETYCCGMEIAKQAGYPYSWRGSSNLSIHSKYPIIDTIKLFRPFNSHAVVLDVQGQHFLCVNLWLHYLPDYFRDIQKLSTDSLIAGEGLTRLKEIRAIMQRVDSLDKIMNTPIIIGGDFNSGSHLDWIESTKGAHYNKIVQWPVSKLMEDRGFKDSFRAANPDPLKTLDGTWGFLSDNIISDRIDFVYFRGKHLVTKFSKIVQDDPPGGFFNSDHRAIISEFVLYRN